MSLPTGSGKSLCYFVLPYTFDILRGATSSIVVIVSPLSALMKEQVEKLRKKGAKAVYTGDITGDELECVHAGEYQYVFTSPETLLTNMEWRDMLQTTVYEQNLVGLIIDEAHCVKQW